MARKSVWTDKLVEVSLPPVLGAGLGDMPPPERLSGMGLALADGESSAALGGGATDRRSAEEKDALPAKSSAPSSVGGGLESEVKGEIGKPFVLSEGLPPIPHKLAARIMRGEYVDMAELLRDNLEAQRRATGISAQTQGPSHLQKHRREIPDLLSWVQCFGTYMAVLTSKHPDRVRQLLAYQTLIVREARRCGGRGWLAYDSYFRQQVVGDDSADWSKLNQSLYAVTFIAQGDREKGRNCGICLECDHAEEQCALYSSTARAASGRKDKSSERGGEKDPAGGRGKQPSKMACFAWNQSECRYPLCRYRHVCTKCGGDHRVFQCPWLREKEARSARETKLQGSHEGR